MTPNDPLFRSESADHPLADRSTAELKVAEVSVLVVDDNDDMRYLMRTLVALEPAIGAITEATSASTGLVAWRRDHPDVIVLDYRMEDGNGLDAAREILAEEPTQAVILFSAFLTEDNIAEAERLGVRECVSKDEVRRLPAAIIEHRRPT